MQQRIKETIIYMTQDEAVKAWETLIKNWFKFEWKWVYYKWYYTYQIWYDDKIPMTWRKLEYYEEMWTKKAKKLGLIAK